MFRIVKKESLTPLIYRMEVEAPRVASSALPGQFLIVRTEEKGERGARRVFFHFWPPGLCASYRSRSKENPFLCPAPVLPFEGDFEKRQLVEGEKIESQTKDGTGA